MITIINQIFLFCVVLPVPTPSNNPLSNMRLFVSLSVAGSDKINITWIMVRFCVCSLLSTMFDCVVDCKNVSLLGTVHDCETVLFCCTVCMNSVCLLALFVCLFVCGRVQNLPGSSRGLRSSGERSTPAMSSNRRSSSTTWPRCTLWMVWRPTQATRFKFRYSRADTMDQGVTRHTRKLI